MILSSYLVPHLRNVLQVLLQIGSAITCSCSRRIQNDVQKVHQSFGMSLQIPFKYNLSGYLEKVC